LASPESAFLRSETGQEGLEGRVVVESHLVGDEVLPVVHKLVVWLSRPADERSLQKVGVGAGRAVGRPVAVGRGGRAAARSVVGTNRVVVAESDDKAVTKLGQHKSTDINLTLK